MSDEKPEGGLSEAETAYFESAGTAPLAPELPEAPTQEGPAEEPVNTDGSVNVRDEKGRFVKTIPFDVFHAEREEHKRTKAEMAELRDFKARMDERWRALETAAAEHGKQAEPEPPDPDKDIFAALKYERDKRAALEAKIAESEKQSQEQQKATAVEQAIWSEWQTSVQQTKATTPDFGDAVKHLSDLRVKQLTALGNIHPAFKTQQGITQQINRELRDIIITAKQSGVSPATAVYELAKAWGYAGPKPKENAALELPAQLANIAKAQEASRTVGAASGAAAAQEMSLEQIMAMPMPEFQTWYAEPKNARRYDKLMGAA